MDTIEHIGISLLAGTEWGSSMSVNPASVNSLWDIADRQFTLGARQPTIGIVGHPATPAHNEVEPDDTQIGSTVTRETPCTLPRHRSSIVINNDAQCSDVPQCNSQPATHRQPQNDNITCSVATAQAVESQLSGCCALNKLDKIMKILVELE